MKTFKSILEFSKRVRYRRKVQGVFGATGLEWHSCLPFLRLYEWLWFQLLRNIYNAIAMNQQLELITGKRFANALAHCNDQLKYKTLTGN